MKKRLLTMAFAVMLIFCMLPISALAEELPEGENLEEEILLTQAPDLSETDEEILLEEGAELLAAGTEITEGSYRYLVLDEENKTAAFKGLKTDYASGNIDVVIPEMVQGYTVTEVGDGNSPDSKTTQYICSVSVPATVKKIQARAFYNCTNLASLTFVDGSQLESIGKEAFEWDSALGSVSIPATVTDIGEKAFYCCSQLAALSIEEGTVLKTIGEGAFNTTRIVSVTIPKTVESIGRIAFGDCEQLKTVAFEEGSVLHTLGYAAFRGCKKLESVALPAGVSEIPEDCFLNCQALTALPFSQDAQIISIGEGAFRGCKGLSGSLVLPASVQKLGRYAFNECTGITGITLPAGLTDIGESAFYMCSALQKVLMPACTSDGVTLGDGAFDRCTLLSEAEVIPYANRIGEEAFYRTSLIRAELKEGLPAVSKRAFEDCKELKEVVIPSTVRIIDDFAFGYCEKLTGVSIPEGVETIGDDAFVGCKGLTAITIPSTVSLVETYSSPFANCDNLAEITVSKDNPVYDSRNGCNAIIHTADGILAVGCKNTVIPASVTEIGEYAFDGVKGMTKVAFADPSASKLTTLTHACFRGCEDLVKCELPAGVQKIDQQVFDGCKKLETLILPDGITEISSCFYECSALKNLRLPYGLTKINAYLLDSCSGLETVQIPSSVTEIPMRALKSGAVYSYQGDAKYWEKIEIDDRNPVFTEENLKYVKGDIQIRLADVTLQKEPFAWTGMAVTPVPIVTYRQVELEAGRDYQLAYSNNIDKGTATMTITGKGSFTGECNVPFVIGEASVQKDISKATVSGIANKTYTGSAITQNPVVKLDGVTLKAGTDYTVAYSKNKAAGTATITITGKGSYTGTVKKTFVIKSKALAAKTISLAKTAYTYTGKVIKPAVTVKDGKKELVKGTDYTVAYAGNKAVGKATVTIKGKGNYTGTVKKTFVIKPKGTSLVSLTAASKAFTVKWKKQAVQTTGYQIQYSLKKNFSSGNKLVTVKKPAAVKKKLAGLKSKRTYYVRIRTYKTIGGTSYYSAWSKVKSVKTK